MKLPEAWPLTSTPSPPLPRAVLPPAASPMRSFTTKFLSVSTPDEADAVARVARDGIRA